MGLKLQVRTFTLNSPARWQRRLHFLNEFVCGRGVGGRKDTLGNVTRLVFPREDAFHLVPVWSWRSRRRSWRLLCRYMSQHVGVLALSKELLWNDRRGRRVEEDFR